MNKSRRIRFLYLTSITILSLLAAFGAVRVLASSGAFDLPDVGCPQAHCDLQMSDQIGVTAPETPATVVYTDDLSIGSVNGLGCSSNGVDTAACTFGQLTETCPTGSEAVTNTLAIYHIDGSGDISVWRSDELLSCRAYASAPLIAEDGSLITADEHLVVRINADNSTAWATNHETGALPISPILVQTAGVTQAVVLATSNLPGSTNAPVYAYDAASGEPLGSALNLTVEGDRFATRNTPGGLAQRIYVSAVGITNTTAGRLMAIDVLTTGLTIAWGDEDYGQSATSFIAPPVDFLGESGASPLVVPLLGNNTQTMILFDGDLEVNNETEPHIIAVRDDLSGPSIVWTKTMTGAIKASFALDLRDMDTADASFWAFTTIVPGTTFDDHQYLYRYKVTDGDFIEEIDVDQLVNETGVYVPSSAISMAGSESDPVLIVAVTRYVLGQPVKTFVIAIDLDESPPELLWKVEIPLTLGQFPITNDATNGPLVWSTTKEVGVRVIGEE